MPGSGAPLDRAAASFGCSPFLDVANGQVVVGGRSRPIRPKTLAVLQHLIAHAGRAVSHGELRDVVWKAPHGADGGPKQCIRELRGILDDDAKAPRFIETVGRFGYRLIGSVSILAQTGKPPESRLFCVGRGAELDTLSRQLISAQSGQRTICLVSGAAGDGKTTLIDAFVAAQASQPSLWSALGVCTPSGSAREPYGPLLDIVGKLIAGPLSQLVIELMRTVAPAWIPQFPGVFGKRETDRAHGQLTGSSPERMRRELTALFERLSLYSPGLILLEDIHWADPNTLAWLDSWMRRRDPAHVMIVATLRSGEATEPDHPLVPLLGALHGSSQISRIKLAGLDLDAVRTYVEHRCRGSRLPPSLPALIAERTGGHPIFVSALTHHWLTLAEQADEAPRRDALDRFVADIPTNARAFIDSQVALLPQDDRRILHLASIAGMEFAAAALADRAGDVVAMEMACESLASRQLFLRRVGIEEWPDGTVSAKYAFRHLIYQQSLHDAVPPATRIAQHRGIAVRLERGFGGEAGTIARQLAHHFESGRDYLRAARYWRLLGERALTRRAAASAHEQLRHALELLTNVPDSTARATEELAIQLNIGLAMMVGSGVGSEEADDAYARSHKLAARLRDRRATARALRGLWEFNLTHGNTAAMTQVAAEIKEMLPFEDDEASMWAHNIVGQTWWVTGAPARAGPHIEAVVSAYDPARHADFAALTGSDPGVQCHAYATITCLLLGKIDNSNRHFEQGMSIARQLQRPFAKAQMLWTGAIAARELGLADLVRQRAESLLAICDAMDIKFWRRATLTLLGWAEAIDGSPGGIDTIRASLKAPESSRTLGFRAYRLMLLADALGCRGFRDDALAAITEAFAIRERTGEEWYLADLHRLRGELLLESGTDPSDENRRRAHGDLKAALRIATRQKASLAADKATKRLMLFE